MSGCEILADKRVWKLVEDQKKALALQVQLAEDYRGVICTIASILEGSEGMTAAVLAERVQLVRWITGGLAKIWETK